jgi:hypothetical protein
MKDELFLINQWTKRGELYIESYELREKARQLLFKADKKQEEGDKIWEDSIYKVYGNIKLHWLSNGCLLDNGQMYYTNIKG